MQENVDWTEFGNTPEKQAKIAHKQAGEITEDGILTEDFLCFVAGTKKTEILNYLVAALRVDATRIVMPWY